MDIVNNDNQGHRLGVIEAVRGFLNDHGRKRATKRAKSQGEGLHQQEKTHQTGYPGLFWDRLDQ